MSDRELLELAAKAAGVCLHPEDKLERSYGNGGCDTWCSVCKKDTYGFHWNPLTDDGDALRLAVKLGILNTRARGYEWPDHDRFMSDDDDPYAATRRAIVRAAAAIAQPQEQT